MYCSVIIPTYNPTDKIAPLIHDQFVALQSAINKPIELIIVDDGSSTDLCSLKKMAGTLENATLHLQKKNQGKGAALRKGMASANGEIILYTDTDFPYTLDSMLQILSAFNNDVKMAIGVRPKTYFSKIPFKRKLISNALKLMNRLFMTLPTSDTQAGLKAFKKELTPTFLSTKINGFLFELEFLQKIKKQKVDCALVEIELREGIELSEVKLGSLWNELKTYLSLING